MKTEKKVLLGFLLLGLFIAVISFFLAKSADDRLVKIGMNYSEALRMVQSIQSKTMGAIEESFAYVLSGEKIEKREYLEWDNEFSVRIKKFIDFVALHNMESEGEKKI